MVHYRLFKSFLGMEKIYYLAGNTPEICRVSAGENCDRVHSPKLTNHVTRFVTQTSTVAVMLANIDKSITFHDAVTFRSVHIFFSKLTEYSHILMRNIWKKK